MSFRPAYQGIDRLLLNIEKNKTGFIKDDLIAIWNRNAEYSKLGDINTIENGILIIEAKNSSCLQELTMMKEKIKKNMNKVIGSEQIINVRFRLGGTR